MMTEEQKLKFLRECQEAEMRLLENGGERCGRCGVVWEDSLAALCCPCHDDDYGLGMF